MDIVTQTILGAAAAQVVAGRKAALGRRATAVGAVGGVLADSDVLLNRFADPALPWELHRHFTHSLAFIPVGALIAALPFMLFPSFRKQKAWTFIAALSSYATHGVLDACTSYGTHLGWPFTNARVSWDFIAIIDPLFSIPLLLCVLAAVSINRWRIGLIGFLWACSYMSFAAVQQSRAVEAQRSLAESRGHEVVRRRVMPTLGNTVVWRSIYETPDGRLHADAIRTGLPIVGSITIREGESIMIARPGEIALPVGADEDAVRDRLRRFAHFADGYLVVLPASERGTILVGDARYSLATDGFEPLWGLRISRGETRWAGPSVDRREAVSALLGDVFEPGPLFRSVDGLNSAR